MGIKKWGAEAKARYLSEEVRRAVAIGASDPFREVGKRVGSNALGVRNSFLALEILKWATGEYAIDTRQLRNKRFGVWTRALNSADIRAYIGLGEVSTYQDVTDALKHLHDKQLARVIGDLTPPVQGGKALVEDSRDITDYGRILQSERASSMLARYRDFDLAQRIVSEGDLPARLRRLRDECNAALQEVQQVDATKDLLAAASELNAVARSIVGAVREALTDDE